MALAADTKCFTLQVKKEGFGDLNVVAEPQNASSKCLELDFCWFICVQIKVSYENLK